VLKHGSHQQQRAGAGEGQTRSDAGIPV
jgi:hypothetical protein